ncbi:hypothetical protein J6590_086447 [Homalodisca vitripennis]|nr:hypothetical protein J6590_086447 [Homalodisca vitripennis]
MGASEVEEKGCKCKRFYYGVSTICSWPDQLVVFATEGAYNIERADVSESLRAAIVRSLAGNAVYHLGPSLNFYKPHGIITKLLADITHQS